MKIMSVVLFSIVVISLISNTCDGFEIGVQGNEWLTGLNGNGQVDTSAIEGTDIDVNDDLGFGDTNVNAYKIFISGQKHNFVLSYQNFDDSGKNRIAGSNLLDGRLDGRLNGRTYALNQRLKTSLNLSLLDLYYHYDFIHVDNLITKFELGGIFQVKYFDGEVSITAADKNKKTNLSQLVPMIGMNLKMKMMSDMVEANLRGTGISFSHDNGYELMGKISWRPAPFVGFSGGYRAFAINLDEDDFELDYNWSGPYVAVELSF